MDALRSATIEWGDVRLTRLVASPLLAFCRYECTARGSGVTREHFPRLPALVMPHAVPFVWWHRGRRTIIDPNSYLFMNGQESYRASHPFGCGDHGSVLVLQPPVLGELMKEFDPSVEERPTQPFTSVRASSSPAAYAGERLLLKLARSTPRDDVLSLEELAFDLARHAFAALAGVSESPHPGGRRSSERELCEEVKEMLARRPYQPLSLAVIAADLGVSASYLERTFRRVTGSAIGRYRRRLRLREALRLVMEGDRELAAVALGLGFSSHSHFTAAFRREFGFTPRALRRVATTGTVRALLQGEPTPAP
jgi:AraC-like DNA-binding protein